MNPIGGRLKPASRGGMRMRARAARLTLTATVAVPRPEPGGVTGRRASASRGAPWGVPRRGRAYQESWNRPMTVSASMPRPPARAEGAACERT